MSLRLRLIVAFFLLSVVPLAALTLYGYTSNARAMRDAARHEAELLAGELTQRMQVVTAQLSDRVEYLMDLADAAAAVDHAVETTEARAATEVALSSRSASATTASETLGSIAMLLNNVELRDGFRGRGRGLRGRQGGGGRGGVRGDPARGAPPSAAATTPGQPTRGGFDRGGGPARDGVPGVPPSAPNPPRPPPPSPSFVGPLPPGGLPPLP